jgi:hypothetical protein
MGLIRLSISPPCGRFKDKSRIEAPSSLFAHLGDTPQLSSVSFSSSSPPWLGAVKIFSLTILHLPHHIPLITALSLWWSVAMELIYSKMIIYFSSPL